MAITTDPFVGTWKLNPERSTFDANHRPTDASMIFELQGNGRYVMTANGVSAKGEPVTERPQEMTPDGAPYPVDGYPGLVMVSTRPDARTLHTEVRREDGSIAGGGTWVVSADGNLLTATTFGFDSQLREFKQRTVWDRA